MVGKKFSLVRLIIQEPNAYNGTKCSWIYTILCCSDEKTSSSATVALLATSFSKIVEFKLNTKEIATKKLSQTDELEM